ncbi:cytochrome P450 [Rhizophagus irregularis]|uniref:Cytochrome P450 n=1 Tax=Rhizophagus irregularis TaxID=588596 RepID=A0A2I1GAA4_9GLOM|nr:cytochrome P450 [Rhizophagus irregularis]
MYQAIILGFILIITLYVLKRIREPKLNMPPLVRYKIPIIGHTYSYLYNTEEFLKQCRKEYGDIFCLYIWGQVRIIVGKEHSQEVLSRDDVFDFSEAFERIFPGDVMLKTLERFTNASKVLKEYVLNKMKFYNERMQNSLYSATKKQIGECDEPKVIYNIYKLMTKIISTPIANIFVGEEVSQYEEIITTFAEFTSDSAIFLMIPPILDFIYPGLQNYINRIIIRLGLYNPAVKHQDILIKHLKKQICKRLQDKEKYALNNMKKLDSFIRESLRLTGFITGLQHAILKDYTFSNGLQVPENYLIDLYFDDIYGDESLQGPNPKSFEPFRHLDANVPASKVTRNYLAFGGGKHACPGRQLAINEIKFFMHNAILKYNFRTESGKIEEKRTEPGYCRGSRTPQQKLFSLFT